MMHNKRTKTVVRNCAARDFYAVSLQISTIVLDSLILLAVGDSGATPMRDEFHSFGFVPSVSGSEFIHICVERWTTQQNDRKTPILSRDFNTVEELDEIIESLKADLDQTRIRAKRAIVRRNTRRAA